MSRMRALPGCFSRRFRELKAPTVANPGRRGAQRSGRRILPRRSFDFPRNFVALRRIEKNDPGATVFLAERLAKVLGYEFDISLKTKPLPGSTS